MKSLVLALGVSTALAAPAIAAPTAFNGHLYEFVSGSFTWQQALANAAGVAPIAGYTAHLATITSAAEEQFVSNVLAGSQIIWLAGTDEAVEGVWTWAAGPETGQIFFGPGAPGGAYSNWNGGEPNNLGDEDYLQSNAFGPDWNDIPASFLSGYVVEYSANGPVVPEPATWAMMIAGFGLAGAALRRRSITARFA